MAVDDPPDLIPGVPDPGSRRMTCEFCECNLAGSGEVLRRSARAKELMELGERVERQGVDLDAARAALEARSQELAAVRDELAKIQKKSRLLSW